jgi:clan AA aspartic protease (TIGR02281 family)
MNMAKVLGWQSVVIGFLALAWTSAGFGQESKTAESKTAEVTKAADLPPEIATAFEAQGLRLTSTALALDVESEVMKAIKDLPKAKKNLMLADREKYGAEAELEAVKQQISDFKKRHTLLSAQMANVTDVVTNNRLVGELNKTAGIVDALLEQQEKSTDKVKAARSKSNDQREAFVQTLLGLRASADKATQKWETLATDKELAAHVEEAAELTGKKLALKPSPAFVNAEKQLKTYEEAMIAEAISLENESGTLWINVAVNGKPVTRMVVDSGATSISLPYKLAKELGIEPKESDPDIMVGLADGSRVPAKLITIASVRVGKFTAENVECIVMDESASEAPPLLGMSFLGRYKFEIDTDKSELRMVKVDSGEPDPRAKAKKKKTK